MLIDPVPVFSIAAAIIFIAFAADQLFKRSGIPPFLFLILVGIIIGPILGWISTSVVLPILSIIAELTLTMVLFYGGMDINMRRVLAGGGRVLAQVFLYVIPSVILIAFFANYMLGWGWTQAIIFGSIVGGETTAVVIVPLTRSLKLNEATRTFLVLESALNSMLSVILFLTFVGFYQTGSANLYTAATSVVSSFSIGIIVGLFLSLIWIFILDYVQRYKYTYVLTLGLLLVTYAISSISGGSALLAVLVFGMVLGNHGFIGDILRKRIHMMELERRLFEFQGELSFLLEAFIFVFLGLIFSIVLNNIIFGVLIGGAVVAILLGTRTIAVSISTLRSVLSKDRKTITLFCAQGVTPATLAILAIGYGIPLAGTFVGLVTYTIIFTNIITTIGSFFAAKVLQKQGARIIG